MGTRVLSKVQYGKETAHGTAVAADTMLLCTATLPEADRETKIPTVNMGVRSNKLLSAAYTAKILADGVTLADADGAYYQLLPLLLSMGIKNITPAEQTPSQADYLWDAPAPQTAAESVDSVTLEVGDDTQGYEVAYCLARRLTISGDCESGECHVSADVFGDQIVQTTLTGALAVPSVEMINAKLSRLYINDTWAALGNTELASALVNWELVMDLGVHPKFLGSASRKFTTHGQAMIGAELTLTLERIAGVATEELKYRPASGYAVTPRFVRVEVTGNQIGSGEVSTLTMDLAGVWTSWQPLGGDREGNTLDVVKLAAGYDITGAQAIRLAAITNVASI